MIGGSSRTRRGSHGCGTLSSCTTPRTRCRHAKTSDAASRRRPLPVAFAAAEAAALRAALAAFAICSLEAVKVLDGERGTVIALALAESAAATSEDERPAPAEPPACSSSASSPSTSKPLK